jgi:REP element-mobilizing transposase RayT
MAGMARKLRVEYAGAVYHVMNRGDRREPIFHDDTDREQFLATLGEACQKAAWEVHAFCLMPNHFHLVVGTPQGNLVAGMQWMLGTYTGRFNRLPVRAARRQGGTGCSATCSAGATRRWWWTAAGTVT